MFIKILQHIKTLRSLNDIVLFIRIIGLASLLPLLVRYISPKKLLALLSPRSVNLKRNFGPFSRVIQHIDAILTMNILMFRPKCLYRSLLGYRFLKEQGLDVHIYYGIRKNKRGRLEGHSWLTIHHQTIGESPPLEYQILYYQ